MSGPSRAWKLPGYVVEERLGTGGSGQVWRARERSGGAVVAIKLLPAVDRDQLAAVRAEAAMLSGLDHPHLLHLREVLPCRDGLALVVDLAAGGSLASLLASRGRLSAGEVVTAVAPIGAALAYAHNAGVVHGDVSAANLLFTGIGLPLLADLGVARLTGDDSPVSSTPAYVDPAVAAGGVPAPASDVFMLGAVALHALTGDPPWPGTSPAEVLAAAAAGDLGDVGARMRAARVPEAVVEVVGRALELDAERRPTAAEFALDLRHAAEPVAVELAAGRSGGDDHGTFTHAMRPPARRPVPRGARGRIARVPRVVAIVAAAVLAIAVASSVLWWPRDASGDQREGRPPSRSGATAQRSPQDSAPAGPTAQPTHPTSQPARPTSTAPSGRAHTAPTMTSALAARTLATLDATRARAFAARDPRLLTEVYSPGPLRSQDTAMITRIVPAGCGLDGVRTDYTDVIVTGQAAARVVLRVHAALRPSTLRCSGTPKAAAPGSRAATMTIVLVRAGPRYLIDAITR